MQNTNCEQQAAAVLRLRHAVLLALAIVAALIPLRGAAQMSTTTVQGTIYRADGSAAAGTVLISWPAFTTPQNQAVAAGNLSATIGANGFLSVNLTPNAGALPSGSYYTAVYHLSDGSVNQEYWVVPVAPAATVAAVRALLQPSTVAVAQTVTPAYVNSAVTAITGNYLPLSGGSLTGPLNLNSDPMASSQAATKHYADQLFTQSLPLSGGTLTGPLNAQQMEGAFYADQWQNGAGNNGLINSLAQCASLPYACQIVEPALYALVEQQAFSGSAAGAIGLKCVYGNCPGDNGALGPLAAQPGAAVLDQRYGVPQWFFNNSPAYPARNTYTNASPAFVMNMTSFPQGWNSWAGSALFLQSAAFMGGRNSVNGVSAPNLGDKTNQNTLNLSSWKYTQTQNTGDLNQTLYCFGNGDCVAREAIIYNAGGPSAPGDESNESDRVFNLESTSVFDATVAGINTNPGDGSLTISTTFTPSQTGNGSQGEDRPVIDLTQAWSTGYVSQISTSGGNVVYQCPASVCGWSTQFGTTTQTTLTSAIQNANPGVANSFPMTNVTLQVVSSSGFAIGAQACVFDYNYECEQITGVSPGSITVATMRLPHPVNAWVTTGGATGYGIEMAADEVSPANLNGINVLNAPQATMRHVFPILTLTASGGTDTLALLYGYNYLPGSGMEAYTGRAYTRMGGSGGGVSLTIAGGAVTGCAISAAGSGYVSAANPPQVNITGSWTTAPAVYVSGVSGGALTACTVSSGGSGVITASAIVKPTNAYAIYPMAKVWQVYNSAIGKVDGTLWTEPSSGAFRNGDVIEQPHSFIQRHVFGNQGVGGFLPAHQAEPNFLRLINCYGVWQGNDACGDIVRNQSSGSLYSGWPAADPWVIGQSQLRTPFGHQLLGPHNSAIYMDTPPFGQMYGFEASGVLAVGCGSIGCSAWTGGYNVFEGFNALGGADALHYNPAGSAWQLTAGSTQFGGGSPYCSLNFTGSSTGGLALACNGTSTQFDTHGNLALPGSLHAQGAVTGATINGEVTVDGVAYTSLNAAWNAAASQAVATGQNQAVRLGPGSFPVTATLTEPTNGACVNLLGSGGTTMNADSPQIATTLTVPASLGGDVLFLGNTAQAQGCTFRDLNLLAAGNATHGFELQWFRGLLIDNVTVNDTTAEGILLGEENKSSGHQASFLLRNATVSYSSAAFTPANRPAWGIHLEETAMDSHLDNIVVRNALTAAIWNEGTGNTGYLIHGFGYPYTCTTAPCANNAASGSAANASYATNYVIFDTGGAGSVWTDTYADSPAIAGFYVGANGIAIHGGHIQWPDLASFPAANLAYVASTVSNNLLIADVDCLEMASGVNWITYAGASGNPPTYSSVHHLTGCGNYYQSLEPANTTGFSSGGANINDPSGAVPRVWSTPIVAASSYPAFSAQMYTGYQGDAFQAHFSGVNPFFNVTYQGTIRSSGGLALGTVINTASALALTPANKNVIANAAGGPQTLTLPSCFTPLPDNAAPTGLEFTIVKSDTSANAVTVQTSSSQLVYSQGTGAATLVLSAPSTQTLVCGPDYNWYVAGTAAATVSGGSVTSFNGRTGAVVPQASDYAASYDALGAASAAQSNAQAFASNAANITSGKLPHAQLPPLVSTDIPNNTANTTGNASTATALAATPTQCATGYYSTGVTASGAANCLQSWRFTWHGYFGGIFGTATNTSLGAIWSPSASISMTRLDIAVGTAPAGCSTWPVLGIYDSSSSTWLKTVTLAASTYSYRNAVTGVSITAGHNLSMGVQTAGVGCTTSSANAQLTMEYTMNQ